jgi:N-acetylated-alpha-linked acidic dipeptidase
MPLYPGDPLTPGWAGEKGARKLPREQAITLMKIPVLPISYADAQPLLENLKGAVVPESWRGALPLTYHYGPGPAVAHVTLDFDWTVKPLYNVIATIPGATYPDEWIIYGNHHDAWVNGANDPVSGAIVVLEAARALSELVKEGWRPKRTIKFALWDGEEFGLVGSTEWVEKHQDELSRKLVAYINSDTNSKGTLGVAGAPSLQLFMSEVVRDIADPATGKPLLETARAKSASSTTRLASDPPSAPETFELGALGAGSDYVAFYDHLGIASINAGFSDPSSSGVYHSIYDSIHWYTTQQDGGFTYGRALTQVMLTSLLRLANAEVLPFEFDTVARVTSRWMEEVRKLRGGDQVRFDPLMAELLALKRSAQDYEEQLRSARWQTATGANLARLNAIMFRAERELAPSGGLPGRPWYRHRLVAPGTYTGYSAKTLPAIREAVEGGRIDEANREVAPVIAVLREYRLKIEEAARLLRDIS